jgi:hypothetical protein
VYYCNVKSKRVRAQLILPLAALALVFCGCESAISIKTPLSEADYRPFAKNGDLTISGQIPRYSGVAVHLDPATPYADALYRAFERKDKFATSKEAQSAHFNPIMLAHRQTVVADTDGAFSFEHVAPGRYYIAWYDFWLEHSVNVWDRTPQSVGIGVSHQFNFDAPRGKWHYRQVIVHPGENLSDIDFN